MNGVGIVEGGALLIGVGAGVAPCPAGCVMEVVLGTLRSKSRGFVDCWRT